MLSCFKWCCSTDSGCLAFLSFKKFTKELRCLPSGLWDHLPGQCLPNGGNPELWRTWKQHPTLENVIFLGESFHLAASFWNGLFCSPFSWSVFFDIQVWHFNQYRSESKLNWDGGILIAIGTYATLLSRLYHLILHKCLPLMHMHSICTQCFCCRSKLRYSDPWMQSTGRLFTRHDVSLPAPSHLVDRGVVGVISMLLSSFPPTWKSYGQGWSTECCWYNV